MTDEPSGRVRRARIVLSGHLGDAVTVRSSLEDPDPAVRGSALGAAARIGILAPADLARGLRDSDPDVRTRACRIAAAHPGELGESHTALVERLDDTDTVAEVACFACGERPDLNDTGTRRLIEIANTHGDPLVREAAVAAIGSLAGLGVLDRHGLTAAGCDTVIAGGSDIAPVRRRAAVAAAAFEGPSVDQLLDRLVIDRDQQVRQIAEDLRAIESPVAWTDRPRPGSGDAPGRG